MAAQLLGALVVIALNSLFAAWMVDEPGQPVGKRIVFVSGDEADAKYTVNELIFAMEFASIDLGANRGRPAPTSRQAPSRSQLSAH
jgi:predicted dinucleotide-binding enzyme